MADLLLFGNLYEEQKKRNYRKRVDMADLSDKQIRSRFRFKRESLNFIADLLRDDLERTTRRSQSISVEMQVSKETEPEATSTSTHGTNEEGTEADANEVRSSECTYPDCERADMEKETEMESCSERDQSPSVPKHKKRKITLADLQTMQYEVLRTQKKQLELKSMKLEKEIERADLQKENIKLRNEKLLSEIEILKQNVSQNESALLALQVISDE